MKGNLSTLDFSLLNNVQYIKVCKSFWHTIVLPGNYFIKDGGGAAGVFRAKKLAQHQAAYVTGLAVPRA